MNQAGLFEDEPVVWQARNHSSKVVHQFENGHASLSLCGQFNAKLRNVALELDDFRRVNCKTCKSANPYRYFDSLKLPRSLTNTMNLMILRDFTMDHPGYPPELAALLYFLALELELKKPSKDRDPAILDPKLALAHGQYLEEYSRGRDQLIEARKRIEMTRLVEDAGETIQTLAILGNVAAMPLGEE